MGQISFKQQVKNNQLAILSLIIAISSLSYTSWRNETSESQRNTRMAAFEVLVELGKLQQIVDYRFYSSDKSKGGHIAGWGSVSMIKDLSEFVSPTAKIASEQLFSDWKDYFEALEQQDPQAEKVLTRSISKTRKMVKNKLRALE